MTTPTTRRRFLAMSTAAAAGTVVATPAGAVPTDLSGWFSDTDNADEVVDRTGESEVTIEVGAEGNKGPYAFAPAAVRIDPGTKVVREWVNGRHDVVASDGQFQSDYHTDSGAFSHTFEETGVVTYYCTPHKSMGMKGALIVGDAAVTLSGSGSESGSGGSGSGSDSDSDEPETTASTDDGDDERFDGWLAGVDNFDGEVLDLTDEDVVTVAVGAGGNGGSCAFDPPAIHVSRGTTVVWEWISDGVSHDVRAEDGSFASASSEQVGNRYAVRFDGDGVVKYECAGHSDDGMRGAVVVGDGEQAGLGPNGLAVLVGGLAVLGASLREGIGLHRATSNEPDDE